MVLSYPKPDIDMYAYIDDAGDHSIKAAARNREPNGSRWLIIAAVVVRSENVSRIEDWCKIIKDACGLSTSRALHYVKLDENQRVRACEKLATFPIKCIVFCSNKQNMRGYTNPRAAAASREKNFFFHSCVKYLLERVTEFGLFYNSQGGGPPKHMAFTFDKNDMVPFSKLKTYLDEECKRIVAGLAVHNKRPMKTEVVNTGAMWAQDDETCHGLQLADLVAGAFHDATENARTAYKHSLRPALALRKVLWDGSRPGLRKSAIATNGLTLFPPYQNSALMHREREIFEHCGYYFP